MLVLIWIQTVWHSEGIPEIIFQKKLILNKISRPGDQEDLKRVSFIECLSDLKSRDPWFEPHWKHYVFVLGHFILNMLNIVLVGLEEIS